MSKRPLAFILTLLVSWLAIVVRAQKPEPIPLPTFLESGTGAAKVGTRLLSLPFARTTEGLLVGLEPLASELGGTVVETAKGRGYTLSLGDTTYVFGIDSSQIVTGQKLIPLAQRPVMLGATLLVPLDLFEKTFGATTGFSFAWDGARRELDVAQPAAESEVEMVAEVVHLQGTTTLVLRFPAAAVRYRVTETPTVLELRLLGSRFSPSSFVPRVEDPLVQGLKLQADRLRIELAPGTAHERYELAGPPFRLVFDLRPQEPGVVETPTFTPPASTRARRYGVRTIVLDPGHGGVETGALGKGGAVEKELTLLLARELEARLEAALPVRVLLTRSEDQLVPLRTRTALANENQADLLVSIHLNSSLGGNPHGAETYFLSLKASDHLAEQSASAENEAGASTDGEGDLSLILWDLAQSKHLAESQRLATFIQAELNEALGLKDRGVKQAPFVVLMGATMPAVLIEFGFLSNPEEEAKLQDAAYRGQLADAAVRAIARFRDAVEGVEPSAEAPPAAEPPAAEEPP